MSFPAIASIVLFWHYARGHPSACPWHCSALEQSNGMSSHPTLLLLTLILPSGRLYTIRAIQPPPLWSASHRHQPISSHPYIHTYMVVSNIGFVCQIKDLGIQFPMHHTYTQVKSNYITSPRGYSPVQIPIICIPFLSDRS